MEKLQHGDYTTREEIKAYAEREDIELMEAYQRICDAFMASGADKGEGMAYWTEPLDSYGWAERSGIYFYDLPNDVFTRHLTPDQILTAGKQEDLQSEKQADEVAPKQIGELTLGVEITTDLQSVISDYLHMLDMTDDKKARGLIENQLVDLMDLQYQRFNGENNA